MKYEPVEVGGAPVDEKLRKLYKELVETPLHALREPANSGDARTVVWALVRTAYGAGYTDALTFEDKQKAIEEAGRLGIEIPLGMTTLL